MLSSKMFTSLSNTILEYVQIEGPVVGEESCLLFEVDLGSVVNFVGVIGVVVVVVAGVVFVVTVLLLSGCMCVCFYYCFTLICSTGY
jgi:hypothetical protein